MCRFGISGEEEERVRETRWNEFRDSWVGAREKEFVVVEVCLFCLRKFPYVFLTQVVFWCAVELMGDPCVSTFKFVLH